MTLPKIALAIGLVLLYPMQRWIDRNWPREVISDETLYLSAGALKRLSPGVAGLVADIYWIRTVQYFGRKLLAVDNPFRANLKELRLDLLGPLLNIVVTLDPHHIPAYRFGAIFLTELDELAAIHLLERGIRENPQEWRLYQDLGYIHWQAGRYAQAAEIYDRGSRLPGAMWWMRDLAGLMRIKGGSRDAARKIYSGYLEDEDPKIRAQAADRLKQLDALDEIDAMNALLGQYKRRRGFCPESLRALAPHLKAMGFNRFGEDLSPLDPDGFPYELDTRECRARLSPKSAIMR
jgi:tetratricopeptide (TPR) repeat protein